MPVGYCSNRMGFGQHLVEYRIADRRPEIDWWLFWRTLLIPVWPVMLGILVFLFHFCSFLNTAWLCASSLWSSRLRCLFTRFFFCGSNAPPMCFDVPIIYHPTTRANCWIFSALTSYRARTLQVWLALINDRNRNPIPNHEFRTKRACHSNLHTHSEWITARVCMCMCVHLPVCDWVTMWLRVSGTRELLARTLLWL